MTMPICANALEIAPAPTAHIARSVLLEPVARAAQRVVPGSEGDAETYLQNGSVPHRLGSFDLARSNLARELLAQAAATHDKP